MEHGGVAVCSDRDLDEGARGVGHVDEFDRDVERPRPQRAPIGERARNTRVVNEFTLGP